MPFDIIVGRSKKDIETSGKKGTILLGKQYVTMGQVTSLSNNVFLDISRSHVVFVCGKRGSGKSYSLGVIAEGIAKLEPAIKQNLGVIMLDTMGVFWTMKYPNNRDAELLKEWEIEGEGLDIKIFTPSGYYSEHLQKGIPTDAPFSLQPLDLQPDDWCLTFGIGLNSQEGILIARIVHLLRNKKSIIEIEDFINAAKEDKKSDIHSRNVVINHYERIKEWGVFSAKGTPLKELAKAGQVTVLDMSVYATIPNGWLIKSLVIGLVAKNLFNSRMTARKNEEVEDISSAIHFFSKKAKNKLDEPLIWLMIDEAHEMLPNEGMTAATDALITILREGRQPGISLILASQQPGKIHTDVITQSDIVISHRLTAQIDAEALGKLAQSYMREGLLYKLDMLPRVNGAAVVFDDVNERVFPIKVRPRLTWHGGEAPTALLNGKGEFDV